MTASSPLVTIGIPFLNSEDTLSFAIRSVFAQTLADWELILIDDGSTDDSLEIAQAVEDPRVTVLSDGENRGISFRLNQIARTARGKYVARMDADDIMHPERLALQVQYLEANPNVDVVGSAAYTIDGGNNLTGVRSLEELDLRPASVLSRGLFIHPSVTGRAAWFLDNPYDESFLGSEDHELWRRTCETSTFGKLRRPLLFYRENSREPGQYLKHYLKAGQYERRKLRTYGPSIVGWSRTLRMMLQSYLKCEVYRAATLLGAQKALVNKRNSRLSHAEMTNAAMDLAAAIGATAPGLSAPLLFAGGSLRC